MSLTEEDLKKILARGHVKVNPETPFQVAKPSLKTHPPPEEKKKGRVSGNKVEIDGHIFPSDKEAEIYQEYKLDPNIQIISLQPQFVLLPSFKRNGKTIRGISYKADFHIKENGIGWIVEVKSKGSLLANSKSYPMRRKLFLSKYPELRFREIVFDRKKRTVSEY